MKPSKSILDRSFHYVPSTATSVDQTWRKFGWRPTARHEQRADGSETAAPVAAGVELVRRGELTLITVSRAA